MAGGLGVLASTVALGGRDSHPYGPWPRALVCASIRAHGHRWPAGRRPSGAGSGLMLRTSGICCPGSGRRHIGAEGVPDAGRCPAAHQGTGPGVLRVRCATRSATVVSVSTCRRNRPAPGQQPGAGESPL